MMEQYHDLRKKGSGKTLGLVALLLPLPCLRKF
jgi:hypothetical protein